MKEGKGRGGGQRVFVEKEGGRARGVLKSHGKKGKEH